MDRQTPRSSRTGRGFLKNFGVSCFSFALTGAFFSLRFGFVSTSPTPGG
jgi:hypothetical protein